MLLSFSLAEHQCCFVSAFLGISIDALGDAIGAGIVYHLLKAELAKMDHQDLDVQVENENGTSMQEINKNGLVNKGYEEKS